MFRYLNKGDISPGDVRILKNTKDNETLVAVLKAPNNIPLGRRSTSFLDIMTQLLKIIHRSCLERFHGGRTSSVLYHCELKREHLLVDKKALRYFNTDVCTGPCDEDWPLEKMNRCRCNQHIYQLQLQISVPSVGNSSDTAVIICHVNNIPARPIIHFKCIHFASGVRSIPIVACKTTAVFAECILCGAAFR